jgi:hypothetical protein
MRTQRTNRGTEQMGTSRSTEHTRSNDIIPVRRFHVDEKTSRKIAEMLMDEGNRESPAIHGDGRRYLISIVPISSDLPHFSDGRSDSDDRDSDGRDDRSEGATDDRSEGATTASQSGTPVARPLGGTATSTTISALPGGDICPHCNGAGVV